MSDTGHFTYLNKIKMKTINLFLITHLISLSSVVAQNYVNLSFTSQMQDGSYQALDSVKVMNLTRGWEETVYYPDTVLQMINSVEIAETVNNSFQVEQNIPNPFNESTEIRIQLPYDDNLTLSLYDLSGKQYAYFSKKLAYGMHKLQLRVAIPQMYILTIKTSTHTQNIKLLAKENADAFAIIYQNSIPYAQPDKTQKLNTNKEFQSNDSMQFIGYTTYHNAKKTNQIKTLQTGNNASYTFQFPMGYFIGDVFYCTDGSIEGIVCWIADTIFYAKGIYYGSYGKIISLDEPSQGLMYATINHPTYAFDSIDGRVNTSIHMALRSDTSQYLYKERIEAAKWCTDKGENWYFPAKYEMKAVFDNINILNNSLQQNKGITFRTYEDGSIYWTSTEKEGGEYAYTIYLLENKPKISYLQFYSKRYVRAMKWFNKP